MDNRIKKHIVILYCSRKGGHIYPSDALYDFLKTENKIEAHLFNLLDYVPVIPMLDRIGRFGDLVFPGLYRNSYRHLQQKDTGFTQIYKSSIQSIMTAPFAIRRILSLIGDADIVVSIQPEINVIAAKLSNYIKAIFHTVIIDYAIQRLWLSSGISKYYVGNPELADDLKRIGILGEKVVISGIPVREGFLKIMNKDQEEVRLSLGLEKALPTVLIVCGLLGTMMDFKKLTFQLSQIETPFQAMIVFGENKRARRDCESIIASSKWAIYPYDRVENMDEMMWASDVVISKPGSVTIAEILSLGKASILLSPMAGSAQELVFGDYVGKNGAGIFLRDNSNIKKSLEELLLNPEKIKLMSEQAFKLGTYNRKANRVISDTILTTGSSPI